MSETIPFQNIQWETIPKTEHKGQTGTSHWQTVQLGGTRLRIVTYSAGYLADHWCEKGHIVYCLAGEFINELDTGEKTTLKEGCTYIVSDRQGSHRSSSLTGARLFIVDGDFLK